MDDEHSEFSVDVNVSPQFFGWIFSLGKDVRLQYRKQALQIEKYAAEKEIQIEFDDTDLYILTDIAAWKIALLAYFRCRLSILLKIIPEYPHAEP